MCRAILVVTAAGAAASALSDGLYSYREWAPAALTVLTLAIAIVFVRPLDLTRPATSAVAALILLAVWTTLSMLWAPGIDRAWTEADRVALYIGVLVIGVGATRSLWAANVVLLAMGAAGAFCAFYVLVRMLSGSGADLFLGFRLHEPIGYANGQAGFLIMAFWGVMPWAESRQRPILQALAIGVAVLLACLAVLTQARALVPVMLVTAAITLLFRGRLSRGWCQVLVLAAVAGALPWLLDVYAERARDPLAAPTDGVLSRAGLAAIAAAALAALARYIAGPISERLRIPDRVSALALAAVPLVMVVGLIAVVGNPVPEVRDQWRGFTALSTTSSGSQRFLQPSGYRYDLWRIALRQFEAHPLRGVGAGNYASTYYLERRNPDYVRQPHSLELQMLAELGVVGLVALLTLVGAVVVGAIRTRRLGQGRDRFATPRVAASGVCVAWLSHTSVDWLYNLPGLTAVTLLCAGILLARPVDESRGVAGWWRSTSLSARVGSVTLILVLGGLAAGVGRHYGAEIYRERAVRAVTAKPHEALTAADRSLSLNPHSVSTYITAAAAHARLNQYPDSRAALLAAAEAEPFNYVPWALLGDLSTRHGDLAQARADYRRAHALNPFDPPLAPVRLDQIEP